MPKNQITTKNPKETKEFAKELLKEWLEINKTKNSNWLVCLYGDLGSGKTTFVQGLAEELDIKETVNSPTFLIIKKYSAKKKLATQKRHSQMSPSLANKHFEKISPSINNKKYTLYHFDCYRLSDYQELLDLGWEEIISGKNNIIVIEWPEKIEKVLPKKKLRLKFGFIDEKTRKISF